MKELLTIFLLLFLSEKAWSQSSGAWICDSIFKSKNYGCGDMASANTPGGSYPLLKDAFNLNPANLPTGKTPVGVELFWDKSKVNMGFIKGTGKAGFGMATSTTEGPFFSNVSNVEVAQLQRSQQRRSNEVEMNGAQAPNINFGSALDLLGGGKPLSSNFGANLKYMDSAREFRPGLGWNFKFKFANGGASIYKSPTIGNLYTASLGLKIRSLLTDFTYLENADGDPNRTIIISSTFVWRMVSATYGYRKQSSSYLTESEIASLRSNGLDYKTVHTMFGISVRPFDRLTMGFYNNYVLGKGSSFVIQYFF